MADYKIVLEEEGKDTRRLYTDNLSDAVIYARDVANKNHKLVTGKVDDKNSVAFLGETRDVYIVEK